MNIFSRKKRRIGILYYIKIVVNFLKNACFGNGVATIAMPSLNSIGQSKHAQITIRAIGPTLNIKRFAFRNSYFCFVILNFFVIFVQVSFYSFYMKTTVTITYGQTDPKFRKSSLL